MCYITDDILTEISKQTTDQKTQKGQQTAESTESEKTEEDNIKWNKKRKGRSVTRKSRQIREKN